MAVFRSAKRRKINRPEKEKSPETAPLPLSTLTREDEDQQKEDGETSIEDSSEVDLSNLIRARRHVRRPVAGVQFSTTKPTHSPDDESAASKVEQTVDKPIGITNRFVSSSGQVIDVDQHMFVSPPVFESYNMFPAPVY